MAQEMLIEKRAFDLCKWMMAHTEKFPKSARFSVAVRIENSLLEFLECIIVANKRQDKTPLLKKADEALARLRLLFRLSYEMRFINLQSYEFGSNGLSELGKMLGGWLKKPSA